MEYETDDSNKSMLERLKESPRTVSALIIILIVAAAIYAFSGNQNKSQPTPAGEQASQVRQPEATAAPAAANKQAAGTPVTKEQIAGVVQTLPQARKTDTAYVEVAQKGDGLTHLARRATARYLNENTVDFAVTNEHRIYIEDYIKDHMKRMPTRIGTEREIPFELIAQGLAKAKTLNERQLKNLTKYTHVLK